MRTGAHDVAVIGAGPYGLACTAHLRARGLDVRVVGEPMELWRRQMPAGMLLRSSWEASSISDPHRRLTLDDYEAEHGLRLARPVPLEDYLPYAHWYQRQAAPDVDTRLVEGVERVPGGFRLRMREGDAVDARRVVIATGPGGFARRPAAFGQIGAPRVVHSSELRELAGFAGRRTAVIGAGQSAIELAALLHEEGAAVEVIARAQRIRWLRRSAWLHDREGVLRRIVYPPTDVGPVGLSWLVAMPGAFRYVPRRLADRIAYRCIRPAASAWLMPRMLDTRMTFGRGVVSVSAATDGLTLRLDDQTTRRVDRVVLGTGFDVRADRHPLLGPALLADLRTVEGMPILRPGFESSVSGLHFVGAFAAGSFGPVMRFVSGTPFTARALAAHVARARPTARLRVQSASAPA
jgi:cation diffusion facilitator CzcD-associated flavoprotein CzcO